MPKVDIGENMVSRKLKIVCSVKISRLEFVSIPIEQRISIIHGTENYKTRLKNYYHVQYR